MGGIIMLDWHVGIQVCLCDEIFHGVSATQRVHSGICVKVIPFCVFSDIVQSTGYSDPPAVAQQADENR